MRTFFNSLERAWVFFINYLDTHEGAITTVSTTIIAAFTVALAISTKRLWKETKRSGDTAEKTADAATKSAEAAMLNAEAAQKQFLITGRQTDIIEKQKEISRQEFLTTHRPKIRVRHFVIPKDQIAVQQMGFGYEFNISNVGDSIADNITIRYSSIWTEDVADVIALFRYSPQVESINLTIKDGEMVWHGLPHIPPDNNLVDGIIRIYKSGLNYFVIGQITYTDLNGLVKRNTGYLRQGIIDIASRSVVGFKQIEDPDCKDYEYED